MIERINEKEGKQEEAGLLVALVGKAISTTRNNNNNNVMPKLVWEVFHKKEKINSAACYLSLSLSTQGRQLTHTQNTIQRMVVRRETLKNEK